MRRTLAISLLAATALAGCMGDEDEAFVPPPNTGGITCSGRPLARATGLPAAFPKPGGVTYVTTEQRGPTRVVGAYYDGGLDNAYEDYRDALEAAGYTILFDEVENVDSEVAYEDPRSLSTGLVALKAHCGSDDRISVRITNRPA